MNCGVRNAAPADCRPARRPRRRCSDARQRRCLGRPAHQQRRRDQQDPGGDGDHQHGDSPVIGRDQPARERRDRHRRDADAGRDQRHREAAVGVEPHGGRRDQRREEAAGGEADQNAIGELELDQRRRAAGEHERQARAAPRRPAPRGGRRSGRWPRPSRSDATPITMKSSVIALEMPARDQPVSAAIGCRKTGSENIAPMATQVISAPTATMTQR